ncbi:MAG TPA: VOC family protein [Actinomycetota bacterium]|nr:VOC family protein [Actinomycetota bacterium]
MMLRTDPPGDNRGRAEAMQEDAEFVAMVPVSDLDRSVAWYGEVFGLEPAWRGDGVAQYRSAFARFDLYVTASAGTAQHTLAAWIVDDVEDAVASLRDRGVVFEEYDFPALKTVDGIADLGYERAAWFRDPDGNILSVGQPTG